jgi:hypothetical protein
MCVSRRQLSHWRRRVDALLIEVEVDATSLLPLDCAEEIDEGSSKPIDGSELGPAGV